MIDTKQLIKAGEEKMTFAIEYLDGKEQIETYGLEPFISHCKESVWKYKGMWEDFSNTVGFCGRR